MHESPQQNFDGKKLKIMMIRIRSQNTIQVHVIYMLRIFFVYQLLPALINLKLVKEPFN